MNDSEKRKQVLEVLHRINTEEDSSNYILGSILAQWADEIVSIFAEKPNGRTTMDDLPISNLSVTLTVQGEEITQKLPSTIPLSELSKWIEWLQKQIYIAAITIPGRRMEDPRKIEIKKGRL